MPSRPDGRAAPDTHRAVSIARGTLSAFDGSATWAQGATVVSACVNGPVAARAAQEDYRRAVVQSLVRLGGAEVGCGGAAKVAADARKVRRQQAEARLQRLLNRVVSSVVVLESFPRCCFNITVHVMSDDGGAEAAAINAVMVALVDAAIPCRTSFAAVELAVVAPSSSSSAPSSSSSAGLPDASGRNDAASGVAVVDPSAAEADAAAATALFVASLPECGGGILAADVACVPGARASFSSENILVLQRIAEAACRSVFTTIISSLTETQQQQQQQQPTTERLVHERKASLKTGHKRALAELEAREGVQEQEEGEEDEEEEELEVAFV